MQQVRFFSCPHQLTARDMNEADHLPPSSRDNDLVTLSRGASGPTADIPAADTMRAARPTRTRLRGVMLRSVIAVIVGSLILRLASHAMGQMTQFYLDHISRHSYYISHTTRGYVIAAFFVTELLGSLVFGALSDRYGRKIFIVLGPVFGAIGALLSSMTSLLWLLVIVRLFAGLSTGSSVPATLGYISDVTVGRPNLRARVMGMFELTLVGGIAMGAVAGGYLWKFFEGSRTIAGIQIVSPAFGINALIYLMSLATFVWGVRERRRSRLESRRKEPKSPVGVAITSLKHYYRVIRSPEVLMFSPAWISIFAIIGIWTNHSAALLTGKRFPGQLLTGTVSPEKFGNGSATLAIFFALGVLAWSLVLGRFRKTNVMIISTLSLFGLLVTVLGLNHLGSFSSPFYYSLLGALLIEVLILSGFTPAALTYLADVTESYAGDRGSIMGLYSVFLGIGQLIGTSVGGYFAEWRSIDGLLLLSAILGGVTAISLLVLRRREQTLSSSS